MVKRNLSRLTRTELSFWERVYDSTHSALLSNHDGRILDTPGLTRICEEQARDAVQARRRAAKGIGRGR